MCVLVSVMICEAGGAEHRKEPQPDEGHHRSSWPGCVESFGVVAVRSDAHF